MIKLFFTLLFLISISLNTAFSQSDEIPDQRNFAYLEIGGVSLFSSVNYERQLGKEPGFSLRAGIGFYHEDDLYITYNLGTHFLFALNKSKSAFIDLGVGVSLANEYIGIREDGRFRDQFLNLVPGLAFRKQFKGNTFMKLGINLVMNDYGGTPWAHFAIGKRF